MKHVPAFQNCKELQVLRAALVSEGSRRSEAGWASLPFSNVDSIAWRVSVQVVCSPRVPRVSGLGFRV